MVHANKTDPLISVHIVISTPHINITDGSTVSYLPPTEDLNITSVVVFQSRMPDIQGFLSLALKVKYV